MRMLAPHSRRQHRYRSRQRDRTDAVRRQRNGRLALQRARPDDEAGPAAERAREGHRRLERRTVILRVW